MIASVQAVAPVAPVANTAKNTSMRVWQPFNNYYFETLSYLPPLSNDQIARQVQYMVRNNMTPCIEFADEKNAIVSSESCVRMGPVTANYFDNRYWTMWKLPMFGCTDPTQVLMEIAACKRAFPNEYIRVCGFDSVRQVQTASFLVSRPRSALPVERRSV